MSYAVHREVDSRIFYQDGSTQAGCNKSESAQGYLSSFQQQRAQIIRFWMLYSGESILSRSNAPGSQRTILDQSLQCEIQRNQQIQKLIATKNFFKNEQKLFFSLTISRIKFYCWYSQIFIVSYNIIFLTFCYWGWTYYEGLKYI